uniref:Uncharacterized protein n=1 Tax=Aegilops tauschii subsp. strangulata TaxID=200361 RepID=A0A453SRE4_AEGTS
ACLCVRKKLCYGTNKRSKDISPLEVSPGRSHSAKWPLAHLKISLLVSYCPSSSSSQNAAIPESYKITLLSPLPISNCSKQSRNSEKEEDIARASKASKLEAQGEITAMALAPTSLQSFLTGRPLCTAPQLTRSSIRPASARLSCRASDQKDAPPSWAGNLELKNLGKLAMVAMAAGVLVLAPVDDAMAGKSGGRIGGKAFRSAAPRSSGPRINNSR